MDRLDALFSALASHPDPRRRFRRLRGGCSEFLLEGNGQRLAGPAAETTDGPRPGPAGWRLSAVRGRSNRLRAEAGARAVERRARRDAGKPAHWLYRPRHTGPGGAAARPRPPHAP